MGLAGNPVVASAAEGSGQPTELDPTTGLFYNPSSGLWFILIFILIS